MSLYVCCCVPRAVCRVLCAMSLCAVVWRVLCAVHVCCTCVLCTYVRLCGVWCVLRTMSLHMLCAMCCAMCCVLCAKKHDCKWRVAKVQLLNEMEVVKMRVASCDRTSCKPFICRLRDAQALAKKAVGKEMEVHTEPLVSEPGGRMAKEQKAQ